MSRRKRAIEEQIQEERNKDDEASDDDIPLPRKPRPKVIKVSIKPKSNKGLKQPLITVVRKNQEVESLHESEIHMMTLGEWLEMIEVLPRTSQHVNPLRTMLQQKWIAHQQQKEDEQEVL